MMTIAVAPLTAVFLVAIRLGTVLLFSPIAAIKLLPIHARLLLVLVLSLLIVANLDLTVTQTDDLSLIISGISEFCNGLVLSLSLFAAFAVFQIAGQLIDAQMGLNSLAIFNPADHSHEPLSGHLLLMLAVIFFFSSDGHHKLIQGLAVSFKVISPGSFALFNGFSPVIKQFSFMFSLALMIAAPIVISLLAIDLCGAIVTRNMPQVSTYFLTLPIKIMVGFFVFYLLLDQLNPLMEKGFKLCFQSWGVIIS